MKTELKEKSISNYAFVDSQNLNLGVRKKGWRLDWGKFRLFLRNKYKVSKAFLFIGFIESNASLYRELQEAGYILIFKNVLGIKTGEKVTYKGNVDAELVLHTMIELPNYESAVIVSGDGDFYCLIEYLEKIKKLKKIITPNNRYSSLLRKYAPYITDVYSLKDKLGIEKENERHSRGKQG
ncbi:NYN domain-containing protein [Candidatus Dojkabacteria bacterium]|nr:NYN domain-containing protein [Candidatus Dojkabacteria bacterium]